MDSFLQTLISAIEKTGASYIGPYVNNYTVFPVSCSYPDCTEQFDVLWSTFRKGANSSLLCPLHKPRQNSPASSSSKVMATFKELGAVMLGEYKNNYTPILFVCSVPGCSQEHTILWTNFKKGSNPNLFCKTHQMENVGLTHVTTELVRGRFEEKGAVLLSEYVNETGPLEFVCSESGCTETHFITWNNFKVGTRNGALRCKSHLYLGRHRGVNSPSWKEVKVAPWDRRFFAPWVKEVLRLYDYTCVITGQKRGDLSAHHLEGRAQSPELAYHVSNGVVLRRDLHNEFHDVFCGGKMYSSNSAQFEAFYRIKTGRKFIRRFSTVVINEQGLPEK